MSAGPAVRAGLPPLQTGQPIHVRQGWARRGSGSVLAVETGFASTGDEMGKVDRAVARRGKEDIGVTIPGMGHRDAVGQVATPRRLSASVIEVASGFSHRACFSNSIAWRAVGGRRSMWR